MEDFFDVSERDVDDVKRMICEDDAKLQHLEELLRVWIEGQPHLPKNYGWLIKGRNLRVSTVLQTEG